MDQSTGVEQTLGVGGFGALAGLLRNISKTKQTGTASADWGRKDADDCLQFPWSFCIKFSSFLCMISASLRSSHVNNQYM